MLLQAPWPQGCRALTGHDRAPSGWKRGFRPLRGQAWTWPSVTCAVVIGQGSQSPPRLKGRDLGRTLRGKSIEVPDIYRPLCRASDRQWCPSFHSKQPPAAGAAATAAPTLRQALGCTGGHSSGSSLSRSPGATPRSEAAIWIKLENIAPRGRDSKITCCMTAFIGNGHKRRSHSVRKQVGRSDCEGQGASC